MSEKLTNDNLDDIFRNSIDNLETEPSENFWINASEDTLFKSTQAGKRSVFKWRMVAASLLVMLLGLSAYVVYLQRQLVVIKGKLAGVEVNNGNTKVAQNNVVASLHELKNVAKSSATNETSASSNNAVDISTEKPIPVNNNPTVISATVSNNNEAETNDNLAINSPIKKQDRHHTHPLNYHSNPSIAANSSAMSSNIYSPITSAAINNTAVPGNLQNELITLNANSISFIPINTTQQDIASDGIEPVQNYVRPLDEKKRFLSRFSLSLFYEPYISDELLENESSDIVTYNNVSANEEEVNPFSLGLKASYDISRHFSIMLGCTYYNFNVSVSPTTIYAEKQSNGDIAYFFQTSVGTVQCPYANNTKAGDGIVVSGEEKVSYISIPLQLKYNFNPVNRLNFYVTGGIQGNVVITKRMDMHWQDFNWGQGNVIEGIDNRKKFYESYYVAPGISYRIIKGISIYLEPSLEGSPVFSSQKGTPYVGVGGGITYHF